MENSKSREKGKKKGIKRKESKPYEKITERRGKQIVERAKMEKNEREKNREKKVCGARTVGKKGRGEKHKAGDRETREEEMAGVVRESE